MNGVNSGKLVRRPNETPSGPAETSSDAPVPLDRSLYPTVGAGVHFVIRAMRSISVLV